MTNYIRAFTAFIALFYASLCFGADKPIMQTPAGEWLVKDKTARIRVAMCNKKLWGVISWVQTPGVDENNPDPAKRDRPMEGVPILLGLTRAEGNTWKGDIYNADNGKIYSGSVTLQSDQNMYVEGCALGIFCGGETWKRLDIARDATELCQQLTQ